MLKFASSIFSRLYDRWLYGIEISTVYLLVALVTSGSGFLIVYRNLWQVGWDVAWINKVIYGATFYLCLLGTVVASRNASHISIDILQRLVAPSWRPVLQRLALVIGGLAAVLLTVLAWRYCFYLIGDDDMFLPGSSSWFWRARTWKVPMIPGFALIAFHLLVQGLRSPTRPA